MKDNILFGLTVALVSLFIEKIIYNVDVTLIQILVDFFVGAVSASIVKKYFKGWLK